jgi:hypothetical protein
VMTLHGNADFHIAYFHICDNPDLYGELKEIWDKAKLSGWVSLESLWKAARQLDDEMEQDHNKTNTEYDDEMEQDYNKTNIEYVVKVTSSFCTIL